MAGAIRLVPLDERGQQIIDELEEKAGEQPTESQEDGGRLYHLEGAGVSGEEFDAMLSEIDSEWQEHVTRTSSILPQLAGIELAQVMAPGSAVFSRQSLVDPRHRA